jgi:hypothetical protein
LRRSARADLARLRANSEAQLSKANPDAAQVIAAIDEATPSDREMIFMGFCPAADIANRLDIEWKARGVCTFMFWESEHQRDRFEAIRPGDLIVLKKRQQFGKTMLVSGHGRVTGVRRDEQGHRYLLMDWAAQEAVLEVPLMGCNSTIDVKKTEAVETQMPEEFFVWLGWSRQAL